MDATTLELIITGLGMVCASMMITAFIALSLNKNESGKRRQRNKRGAKR